MVTMQETYVSPVQLIGLTRPAPYVVEYPTTDTVSGEVEERHQDCDSLDQAQSFYAEGILCAGWARIWERIEIHREGDCWTWRLAVVQETGSEDC